MWDETLIESMGKRNNGKRWLTVQVAAIVHAGVIAIFAAASFWYSDAMTLPAQSQPITGVFFPESLPTPPPAFGVHHHTTEANTASNTKPVLQQEVTQNVVPEDGNVVKSSKPFTDLNNFGDVPEGDPRGVNGGLRNGTGPGGFGPPVDGFGAAPITPEQFIPLGIVQPEVIRRIEPAYPQTLLRMHKEGMVILQALITANGDVQKIEILRSDHPLFSQSAINAVGEWKYRPAKLRGKPVAVYFTVTVVFHIK
ncbi:MAG TPA: energy transducer TonB [Acidobacteriota bacterium]